MTGTGTGTGLPQNYAARLQKLLQAEWQVGESYEKFAQRLGLSSSRTLRAWLALDFKVEPDPRKLRQFAHHLGWQYWELIRYLDTGELPERPTFQLAAPSEPSPVAGPQAGQTAKTALRGTVQQLRALVDTMQQWLELLPAAPPTGRDYSRIQDDVATSERAHTSFRPLRPRLPEAMKLPELIAACRERSGMSDKRLAERIDDVGYYTSREIMNAARFTAIYQGQYVPCNETELDALADVVDRDREYFTDDAWRQAWIASIYQGDRPAPATPPDLPETVADAD